MSLSLGTLEIGLGLNTAQYDSGIKSAKDQLSSLERRVTKLGTTPLKIKVSVDDRQLYGLNSHLLLKRVDLKKTVDFYKANPIKVFVEDDALVSLNQELRELKKLSVEIRTPSKIVVEHRFSGYQDRVEKAIERLSVTARNSAPPKKNIFEKAFNLTVGNAVSGFFTGAGLYGGLKAGKGINKGIGIDFEEIGNEFGSYTKQKVKQVEKILDAGFSNLLGFTGGIKEANHLFKKNFNTLFDNITDPSFYKDLEDFVVAALQSKLDPSIFKEGAKLTDSQLADKRIFIESREKLVSRFEEVIKEDFVRAASAIINAISHPLRIRKRVQLRDSSEMVRNQSSIFAGEYEANKARIQDAEHIVLMAGGVDPTQSKPGQPNVDTTYRMAAGIQALFPKAFVDAVTPYHTTSLEDLEQGAYNQILRGSILPFIKEQKESLANIFGEKMVNNLIANLGQFHPIESILRQSVEKGYNDDSIRMATKALASSMLFPDKKITLAGASGGGFIVEEAIAILNQVAKRFPELQDAVRKVKGFGIGTPMANITATSGGSEGEFAKFQAYIGTLDKVGKGFFGENLYSEDKKAQDVRTLELDQEIALPGGILNPKNELQSVIGGWGYKHEVGLMLADLGHPVSEFLLLLSSFLGDQKMRPTEAKKLMSVFNQLKNLSIKDDVNIYISEISSIVKEISSINKKIGGVINTKDIGTVLAKVRQLAKTSTLEDIKAFEGQVKNTIQNILKSSLGIDNVPGLGTRSGSGKGSLLTNRINDLIRDLFNEVAKKTGNPSVFPDTGFDALDPNIQSIAVIEDALKKSAEDLNLPVGDFGSLIQLWKRGKVEVPPVRGFDKEFQSVYQEFLKELLVLDQMGSHYFENVEGTTKVDFNNFLWDAAQIATLYEQPPYQDMLGKYRAQSYNTPKEKQMEKALLAFFALYEKDAEIFKREYLQKVLDAKKLYESGDPSGLTQLTKILTTSKFSRIYDLTKNIDTAKKKIVSTDKILGTSTNYERLNSFFDKVLDALIKFEASNRQDASGFDELSQSGFGINAILDFVNLAATQGKKYSRLPDSLKSSQIADALKDDVNAYKFTFKNQKIKEKLDEIYSSLEIPLEKKTAEIVESYINDFAQLIDQIEVKIQLGKSSKISNDTSPDKSAKIPDNPLPSFFQEKVNDLAVTAKSRLEDVLVSRLGTPDKSGEIQHLSGNEDFAELLQLTLVRELKTAGLLLSKAFRDTSLDVVKFGQVVYAVMQALERPVMALPGAAIGKKAIQVGGTAAMGAAAIHALPMGLDTAVIESMRTILSEALSAGGTQMLHAVQAQMTSVFSGLPFGIGQQLTTAVMQLVTELTNGTINVLASGGAIAGSSLAAGEGVKKLLGAATSNIPKLVSAEEQQRIEGKTQKALKAAKSKADSLITTEITPYFDEKVFPVSNPIPANIKAINPEYYTVKQLRGLARDQGINVPASGVGAKKEEIWKALTERFNPDQLTRLLLTTKASDRTKLGKKELSGFQIPTTEIPTDFTKRIGIGIKNIGQEINTTKDIQSLERLYFQLEKVKKGITALRANPEFNTTGINKSLSGFLQSVDNLQTQILTKSGLESGKDYQQGLKLGLSGDSAQKIAHQNALKIVDETNKGLGNASPSKKGKKSGKDYIKGVEIGVKEQSKNLLKTVQSTVTQVLAITGALSAVALPALSAETIKTNAFRGVVMNPATTGVEVVKGYDIDNKAFKDKKASVYTSGPMFDRFVAKAGQPVNMIADVIQKGKVLQYSPNRAAAEERSFLGITKKGKLEFGYGGLKTNDPKKYDTFIGGLHTLYNDEIPAPANYKGGYAYGLKQQLAYNAPRPRVFFGKTKQGQLATMMNEYDMTPVQLEKYARQMGFSAVMLPDHGNMARLTIPNQSKSRILPKSLGGTGKSTPYQLRFSPQPSLDPSKQQSQQTVDLVNVSQAKTKVIQPKNIKPLVNKTNNNLALAVSQINSVNTNFITDVQGFLNEYGIILFSLFGVSVSIAGASSVLKKNKNKLNQLKKTKTKADQDYIDVQFQVIKEPQEIIKPVETSNKKAEEIYAETVKEFEQKALPSATNFSVPNLSEIINKSVIDVYAETVNQKLLPPTINLGSIPDPWDYTEKLLKKEISDYIDVYAETVNQKLLPPAINLGSIPDPLTEASTGGAGGQPPKPPINRPVASPDPESEPNKEISQMTLEELRNHRKKLQQKLKEKMDRWQPRSREFQSPSLPLREAILDDWNKKREFLFSALDKIEKGGISGEFAENFTRGIKAAIANFDGFINLLSTGGKALRTLDAELNAATGGMINLRKGAMAAIGGFALFKGAEFLLQPLFFAIDDIPFRIQQAVTDSLLSFTELQRIKLNLNLAGVGNVEQSLDALVARADRLGISFKESAIAYGRFKLITTGSPLQAQADNIFEGFQEALAARQTNAQQQAESFRAIGQIASKSVVSVEEFTQQLSESGGLNDALNVAARSIGLTTAQFYQQASAGNLLVQDVLPRLAAEYKRMSAGGLSLSTETLQSEISRFQNNTEQLQMQLGEKIGVVAYPALQTLNAVLSTLNDNLGTVVSVGAAGLLSVMGFLGKSVMQFAAAGRLGAVVSAAMSASLQVAGVASLSTATAMGRLKVSLNLATLAGIGLIKALIIPTAVIAGIQFVYSALNAGSEELKQAVRTLEESKKALDAWQNKTDSNSRKGLTSFLPDMELSGAEKFFNVITLGTVYNSKWLMSLLELRQGLENIDKSLAIGVGNLKEYQDTLSNFSGSKQFSSELQEIRNNLALVRAERTIASAKGNDRSVAEFNQREQDLMKQEQELIDKQLGPVGSKITADLQQYETALASLEQSFKDRDITDIAYAQRKKDLVTIIGYLKKAEQDYLQVLKDQEKEYRKLQVAFNLAIRTRDNANFANEGNSLSRSIGLNQQFASGKINEFQFNVKVQEESLQTAKERIATLENSANSISNTLNERLSKSANKVLSTYFKEDLEQLNVASFGEAIAENLLSPDAIQQIMDQYESDLKDNAALKDILNQAKEYATARRDILNTEKEIQQISREIIVERKKRQIQEKQASGEIVKAEQLTNLANKTSSSQNINYGLEQTKINLAALYNQLAIEQEKLVLNVDDPLTVKTAIANITQQIAETGLSLRDQQEQIQDYYRNLDRQIIDFNRQIEDYRRQIEDAQLSAFKENRSLSESYSDLVRELDKNLLNAQNQLLDTTDKIRVQQVKNRLLIPGTSDAGKELGDIFLEFVQGQADLASRGRTFQSRTEEIETSYISTLRNIRNLQEQQQEAERNRLRTIEDIKRTQENLNRTLADLIRQTNRELGFIPRSIKDIVTNLNTLPEPIKLINSELVAIPPNIKTSGEDLVKSIEETAEAIRKAKEGLILPAPGNFIPAPVWNGGGILPPPPQSSSMPKGLTRRGQELSQHLDNPYVKAFLDTIAYAEGTANMPNKGYNTLFGYGQFSSFTDHPRQRIPFGSTSSSASGRYQIMDFTWDEEKSKLGLKDFSPVSQDLVALSRILMRGGLDELLKGDIRGAINATRKEWASFPGANYPGQSMKNMEDLLKVYEQSLRKYQPNPTRTQAELDALRYDGNPANSGALNRVRQIRRNQGSQGVNVPSQSPVVPSASLQLPQNLQKGSNILVRKSGRRTPEGLEILQFDLIKDGKIVDTVIGGVTGRPSTQSAIGTNRTNIRGSETPLPDGNWSIDANHASRYLRQFNSGQLANYKPSQIPLGTVGPAWIGAEPKFSTGRSQIGFHLDDLQLGSAGCLVFTDPNQIAKIANWVVQSGANSMFVDLDGKQTSRGGQGANVPSQSPVAPSAFAIPKQIQSVLVQEVGGKTVFSKNANTPPASPASTIKLIVADILSKEIKKGTIGLKDQITIKQPLVDPHGTLKSGNKRTVQELLDLMLRVSDNTATNVLIDLMGGLQSVTNKAQQSGYTATTLSRYLNIPGSSPANRSNAVDTTRAMQAILSDNSEAGQLAEKSIRQTRNFKFSGELGGKIGNNSKVIGNVGIVVINGKEYIVTAYANVDGNILSNRGIITNTTNIIKDTLERKGRGGPEFSSPPPIAQLPTLPNQNQDNFWDADLPPVPKDNPINFQSPNLPPVPNLPTANLGTAADQIRNAEIANQNAEEFLRRLEEKFLTETALDRAIKFGRQQEEEARDLNRTIRDASESVTDLTINSKGYLTVQEEINKSATEVSRQYRSQIESLQDQRRNLEYQADGWQKMSENIKESVAEQIALGKIPADLAEQLLKNADALAERAKAAKEQVVILDQAIEQLGRNQGVATLEASFRRTRDTVRSIRDRMNDLTIQRIRLENQSRPTLFDDSAILAERISLQKEKEELEDYLQTYEGLPQYAEYVANIRSEWEKLAKLRLERVALDASPNRGAAESFFSDIREGKGIGSAFSSLGLNIATKFVEGITKPAIDALTSAIDGFTKPITQAFESVFNAIVGPVGNFFTNALNSIFKPVGNIFSSIFGGGGGGGLFSGLLSGVTGLFGGGLGSLSSTIAPSFFASAPASAFSLGTGFSLFSDGGKVGDANAPIEKNIISAFQRERSMSGGRKPRLIVANEDELVLNPKETEAYLEYRNNAPIKNYANGGFVGGKPNYSTTSNNNSSNQSLVINNTNNVTVESRNDMGYSLNQLKERENAQNERTKKRFFG